MWGSRSKLVLDAGSGVVHLPRSQEPSASDPNTWESKGRQVWVWVAGNLRDFEQSVGLRTVWRVMANDNDRRMSGIGGRTEHLARYVQLIRAML